MTVWVMVASLRGPSTPWNLPEMTEGGRKMKNWRAIDSPTSSFHVHGQFHISSTDLSIALKKGDSSFGMNEIYCKSYALR